jgi:hypothetical protein
VTAAGARAHAGSRVALVVGQNSGEPDEVRLRYAEEDAEKVARLLRDLGDFEAEDVTVLRAETAATARRALIRLNERLRADTSGESLLFVYYSGHADARALHLGGTQLPVDELESLVRGSPAKTRVLVVDACRSGALTHVKGSKPAPPFDIQVAIAAPVENEGAVFLTSSAVNEVAQESDDLRGSFFTHFLVSGLRGAADGDGDQRVTLNEAYAYAYEGTLRASSRSLGGTQHPTFSYDLRGHRDVALTRLAPRGGRPMGVLALPTTRSYLVLAGGADGVVVAETPRGPPARGLTLPAGGYFVRGRGRDDLVEGSVSLAANQHVVVDEHSLQRVAYARLVRKGGGERDIAWGAMAGGYARSGLWSGSDVCEGAFAGIERVTAYASLALRLQGCRGGFSNQFITATADEWAAVLDGSHVWDLRAVSLHAGLAAGPAFLHQSFTTTGQAPPRWSTAALVEGTAGLEIPIRDRWLLDLTLAGAVHVFRERDTRDAAHWSTPVTVGARLGVGRRW